MSARDRVSFGATWDGEETTRFRLWAPSADEVALQIGESPPGSMRAAEDGWHALDVACGPGARYRYMLADGLAVPDPASRSQPDGVLGASEVLADDDYRWQQPDWCGRPWNDAIIYELHVGLAGGFVAARALLPGLADLGITFIELMPVAAFAGERNWGYDGVLPFAPQASYGTPDDLKAFVDCAHGLGLSVLLDVVYNHFGPAGNFIGVYAADFFKHDAQSAWGDAIDFTRPQVRDFFIANAVYWVTEFRFDGLRLDAVHAIADSGFLHELAGEVRAAVGSRRAVQLVLENENNDAALLGTRDAFDAQWNDDFHNALHVLLTGEQESYYGNYAGAPIDLLLRCFREGFAYQGEPVPGKPGHRRGTPSGHLPPTRFVNFLQNHDQVGNRAFGDRLGQLVDAETLHCAQVLLLLTPAIPLLFMGEENASKCPFLFFTDFEPPLAEQVRAGRQQEFSQFSAFSADEAGPAIPDPNAMETYERSRPHPSPQASSMRARLKTLIAVRQAELRPYLDTARCVETRAFGPKGFSVTWQLSEMRQLRLACNLDQTSITGLARPTGESSGRVIYATQPSVTARWASGELPSRAVLVEVLEAA